MRSLSIRGVDNQLASLLKQKAGAANKSVNQLVVEALQQFVGLDKKKLFSQQYHDLDSLCGRWSGDDFSQIQAKLDSERQIDPELWK